MDVSRVRITNHNKPGGTFWTPTGMVKTDKDGHAKVTAEQLAHLKKSGGLNIVDVTGQMPASAVDTRGAQTKK